MAFLRTGNGGGGERQATASPEHNPKKGDEAKSAHTTNAGKPLLQQYLGERFCTRHQKEKWRALEIGTPSIFLSLALTPLSSRCRPRTTAQHAVRPRQTPVPTTLPQDKNRGVNEQADWYRPGSKTRSRDQVITSTAIDELGTAEYESDMYHRKTDPSCQPAGHTLD